MKVLKKLNDIMDGYVSVTSRHIHGANCSGAKPLNDDEVMDIIDDDNDADELDVVLLIEFGNLSAEERQEVRVEDVIEEADQAPLEEDVMISSVVRIEEAQEKVAERAEEELLEEERDKAGKKVEKNQPEQSLQIHTNFEPIQSMVAESQENSSNEESSTDGNKLLKSMSSVLSSLQKSMLKSLNTQEEERKDFAEIIKVLNELDNTLKKNTGGDRGGRNSSGGRSRLSNVDQGGRANGGDRGGRSSGGGRGGRSYPPYLNMLPGQDMSPTDPRVKREEQ
ncbi:keratin, type I cytoskeletal 10-like [Impatiens glandulifera]|uniref:keratin, type I cytoskeletal 10-like n=1 Tax=Impatiens glandulifera TaxID=253017 RepID=UPI001FB0B73B|nr:keratin, type I cytoskeletal 10-like [Impatiens glandulifera]